jgi:hypothetical protein
MAKKTSKHKRVRITIYQLDALSEKAQQKALEQFQDINLHPDWWEFVYDNFKTLAGYFGVQVDLKKTYFTGFYHQGQGSSYTADVDMLTLLNAVQHSTWKTYAPNVDFRFVSVDMDKRVIKLIETGAIHGYASVKPANRETSVHIDVDFRHGGDPDLLTRIEAELVKFEALVTDVCEALNHHLFSCLEKEYEYLSSEETIRDTIMANEFYFRENGDLFQE